MERAFRGCSPVQHSSLLSRVKNFSTASRISTFSRVTSATYWCCLSFQSGRTSAAFSCQESFKGFKSNSLPIHFASATFPLLARSELLKSPKEQTLSSFDEVRPQRISEVLDLHRRLQRVTVQEVLCTVLLLRQVCSSVLDLVFLLQAL